MGGGLTDWIGYHGAMGVSAGLALVGAMVALIFLPETKNLRADHDQGAARTRATGIAGERDPVPDRERPPWGELVSATALLAVNRLTQAGFLIATLGLFLQQQWGDGLVIAGRTIGIATLTGVGLGLTTLISMAATPLVGGFSDRARNRWQVAALGLLPGAIGYAIITAGHPWILFGALALVAFTSGSNMTLSTTLMGELGARGQHGRRLGILFTVGDLASAIGPLLAYALIPAIGVEGVYWLAGGLFGGMAILCGYWYRVKLRTPAALEPRTTRSS